MRKKIPSTCLLDLNNTHNVFLWETLSVNRTIKTPQGVCESLFCQWLTVTPSNSLRHKQLLTTHSSPAYASFWMDASLVMPEHIQVAVSFCSGMQRPSPVFREKHNASFSCKINIHHLSCQSNIHTGPPAPDMEAKGAFLMYLQKIHSWQYI